MPHKSIFRHALSDLAAKGAEAERPWIHELATDVDIFIHPVRVGNKNKTYICIQDVMEPVVNATGLKSWIQIRLLQPKLKSMTRTAWVMDCKPEEYGLTLLSRVLDLKQKYQKAKQTPQKCPSTLSLAWLKTLLQRPNLVFATKKP